MSTILEKIPYYSENKPRRLYFSKPFLRVLFLEVLMIGICVLKSARLNCYTGGKYASQNQSGLAYSWKEGYVSNLVVASFY